MTRDLVLCFLGAASQWLAQPPHQRAVSLFRAELPAFPAQPSCSAGQGSTWVGHSPPLPLPSVIQLVIVLTRLPVPHYGLAIISVLGLMSAVKRWDIPPAVARGTLLAHVYQMRDTDLVVSPAAAVSCCAHCRGRPNCQAWDTYGLRAISGSGGPLDRVRVASEGQRSRGWAVPSRPGWESPASACMFFLYD